jgi:hypothetical protein
MASSAFRSKRVRVVGGCRLAFLRASCSNRRMKMHYRAMVGLAVVSALLVEWAPAQGEADADLGREHEAKPDAGGEHRCD